jgi:hypothetical protein
MEDNFDQQNIEDAEFKEESKAMTVSQNLLSVRKELTDFLLDDRKTQRFIDGAIKVREIAIKLTKPLDWVQFGESMHLQDKRLGELSTYLQTVFGVNIQFLPTTTSVGEYKQFIYEAKLDENKRPLKDDKGNNIEEEIEVDVKEYIVTGGIMVEELSNGQVTRKRIIQPITGSSTTADKMWAKRNGKFVDPGHIQPSLVRKKAEANYRGNCLRYIWGLKGVSPEELRSVFGKDAVFADSSVRGTKQQHSNEDKGELGQLWTRLVQAHDGFADKARATLKSMTSYPAGTNKSTGKAYNANPGYEDIYRVKVGSFGHKKIITLVEKFEKQQTNGVESSQKNEADSELMQNKNFKRYLESMQNAKSKDSIIAIEKQISTDKTLNQGHFAELNRMAEMKYKEFEEPLPY